MQQCTINTTIQRLTQYAEIQAPRKFKSKKGQILKLLSQSQSGLSRQELLFFFCQNFDSASFTLRESVRMRVEKLIQRSRHTFDEFNLTIVYDRTTKKYVLVKTDKG